MKRIITATYTNKEQVKNNSAIKELMAANGWRYKGSCNCSGMYTEKFECILHNGLHQMEIRKNIFKHKYPGVPFIKYPIAQLKDKLNELIQEDTTAQEA